jgi:hypothetical protein
LEDNKHNEGNKTSYDSSRTQPEKIMTNNEGKRPEKRYKRKIEKMWIENKGEWDKE